MSKLVNFTASNFKGSCLVDEEFTPHLKAMNDVAVKHNMMVIVTSAFRPNTNVKGAIVKPATMSNHLVGHAIDCNLQNTKTKEYYNSTKMKDDKGDDYAFCQEVVQKTGLRWGGSFNTPDSVHFDDGLNLMLPRLYSEKYNLFHTQKQ